MISMLIATFSVISNANNNWMPMDWNKNLTTIFEYKPMDTKGFFCQRWQHDSRPISMQNAMSILHYFVSLQNNVSPTLLFVLSMFFDHLWSLVFNSHDMDKINMHSLK